MDLDLSRIHQIVMIARTRNFSRAAEALNITQPALSRSIASFEQRYGLKVFDRSRSGVEPTQVGRQVIEEAEHLLRVAKTLDLNLKHYARGDAGKLAVGFGPLLASLLLPQLGQHMIQTYPQIQFQGVIKAPEQLAKRLLNDDIELIFGTDWRLPATPDLTKTPLGSMEIKLFVRAGHPLTQAPQVSLTDLGAFPIASPVKPTDDMLTGIPKAFVCDNYHILREVVQRTDCLCLCFPAFVGDDLAAGSLVALPVTDMQAHTVDIVAVRKQGRTLSPSANQAFAHVRMLLASLGIRPTAATG